MIKINELKMPKSENGHTDVLVLIDIIASLYTRYLTGKGSLKSLGQFLHA